MFLTLSVLFLHAQVSGGPVIRVENTGGEAVVHAEFSINRDIGTVWACLKDVPSYTRIFSQYRSVHVVDRTGSMETIDYVLSTFPVSYRLVRSYDEEGKSFTWQLVQSDWVSAIRGGYTLRKNGNATRLSYQSVVVLKSAFLNLIANMSVESVTRETIAELTRYVESLPP